MRTLRSRGRVCAPVKTMKRAALFFLAMGAALAVGPQIATSEPSADARIADVARTGKLRAGIAVVAPHWAIRNPSTGELQGVAVEIARALAGRMGIELAIVEYPSPPNVLEGLKTGAWDVGFLAIDPSRATVVDFSPPYLQIDATYLVRETSSIRVSTDADRPDVRIAVARRSVEQIVLSRSVKRAQLVEVDTIPAGFELLRAGTVDALAAPRPALLQFSSRLPGSHVLEDRFHSAFGAIAVPKGQTGRLSYVDEFIREAKASGSVQQAIEHAGVRGVQVAPNDRTDSQ
jgi:polar amino acid transport system substrate-binding protein